MKEELQELIEMIESDLELTKKIGGVYDEKPNKSLNSHNEYLENLLKDLKEIVE